MILPQKGGKVDDLIKGRNNLIEYVVNSNGRDNVDNLKSVAIKTFQPKIRKTKDNIMQVTNYELKINIHCLLFAIANKKKPDQSIQIVLNSGKWVT